MIRNWWNGLAKKRFSSLNHLNRAVLSVETLEERSLLTVQPISLADPSLYGSGGVRDSSAPSLSADGQFVVFQSNADNLVPNDTNGLPDVFLYDRGSGAVSLVSVAPDGTAGGSRGDEPPTISPDGRYVAFVSDSAILPGIGGQQVYLRDLHNGTTALLSATSGGAGGNRNSFRAVFSADSRHAAFLSSSSNLDTTVTYSNAFGQLNVFERDLTAGSTRLVSVRSDSTGDGNFASGPFALSADGRYVVFESDADNLVPNDNNGLEDVFVRDTVLGTTTLVSVDVSGLTSANGHNYLAASPQAISADGRYVVFHGNAPNLVSPAPGGNDNSYLRDLHLGTTVLLSARPGGLGARANGSEVVSPDGRWAAFATSIDGVTATPTNGLTNVYVRNLATGTVTLASPNATGTAGGNGGSGLSLFGEFPGGLTFSPDGRYLAFRSTATDLVSGATSPGHNLYLRDLDAGATRRLTTNQAGNNGADADSDTGIAFSADGRFVAFASTAGNLVTGDNNLKRDVFLRDLTVSTTALVSLRSPLLPAAFPALNGSSLGAASADGRYVVFTSRVNAGTRQDVVPGLTFTGVGGNHGVYVRDRQTGNVQAVDLALDGTQVGADITVLPQISADGRYVAFLSFARNLVTGVTYASSPDGNVFVRDLQTGTTAIASVTPNGTRDLNAFNNPEFVLSADGRSVAFITDDPGALPGVTDPQGFRAVVVRNLAAGTTRLVSHNLADNGRLNGTPRGISISADGRYVAFVSNDPDLVANDTNNSRDVFRWDRTTGLVALVSVNAAGTGPGDFESFRDSRPAMTPDGRYIAFQSAATNLVVGDTNGSDDIFVRDMTATSPIAVSVTAAGVPGGNSSQPSISDDGKRIAFRSGSSLSPLDQGHNDVYVRDLTSNTTILVSVNADGSAGGTGPSFPEALSPLISPDGRQVAFISNMNDLVAGYVPGLTSGQGNNHDLFLRNLELGITKVVTINQSGTAGANTDQADVRALFSGDSRTLVFDSAASDLFVGDRNDQFTNQFFHAPDVFAYTVAGFGRIAGTLFDDANGNHVKDAGEAALRYVPIFLDSDSDGQLDPGEPEVITDAAGRYAFTGLSGGTYRVTLVTPAGRQQSLPADGNGYTVTLAADTSAVAGRDFGLTVPFVDLTVQAVSVPAAAEIGDELDVSWTVTNQGTSRIDGNWQDAVYLSTTPTINANSILIGLAPHTGGLLGNASYTVSLTLPLPAVAEGDYFVVVRTDRRRQVTGDSAPANNVGAATTAVALSVPELTLDVPGAGEFSAVGQDRYFKVSAAADSTLLLSLSGNPAASSNAIFVRKDFLPGAAQFDARTPVDAGANPALAVVVTQSATYYIRIHHDAGLVPATFTLTARQPGLSLLNVSPETAGNSGSVTLEVSGTDLLASTPYRLIGPGGPRAASATHFLDSTRAYVTFDLRGAAVGSYALEVASGTGNHVTLNDALHVVAGVGARIETRIIAPDVVRIGRVQQFLVEYANTGDADAPAPILSIFSPTDTPMGFDRDDLGSGANLTFLGISPEGSPGVLRPGARVVVPVFFEIPAPGTGAPTTSPDSFEFNLSYLDGGDERATEWDIVRSWISPTFTEQPNFSEVFAAVQERIGPTWADLVRTLARNISLLAEHRTSPRDLSEALDLEVQLATATIETSLSGRLTSTDPAIAVSGRLVTALGTYYGYSYRTRSLSDGSFLFAQVAPDIYEFLVEDVAVTSLGRQPIFLDEHLQGIALDLSRGATLSGRVVLSGTSTGAVDPTLTAYASDGSVYAARIGADSAYTFQGLKPGTYTLVVDAVGRARTVLTDVVVGSADVARDIEMLREGTIAGSVEFEQPGNQRLTIRAEPSDRADALFSFEADSETAQFRIGQLPAGTWDLLIGAPGYVTRRVAGIVVAAGTDVTLPNPVTLSRAGGISGRVTSTDPDAGPAGQFVELVDSLNNVTGTVQTSSDGSFGFSGISPGTYTLYVNGINLVNVPSVTVTAGATVSNVTLAIRNGSSIVGRVTDSAGQPLARVLVSLFTPDDTIVQRVTDSAGNYRIDHVEAGTYFVTLDLHGPTTSASITVSGADGEVKQADFTLAIAAHLRGRVLDSAGNPLPFATVELRSNGSALGAEPADANGIFDIALTAPGTFDLLAICQGASFALVTGVVVAANASVTQDLIAGANALTVTVGGATAGVRVTLVRQLGTDRIPVATRVTDATGQATFENLTDGTYLVVARGEGNLGAEGSVTLVAGTPGSLQLSAIAQGQVTGIVTAEDGTPLAGATVFLEAVDGFTTPGAVTADDGSYTVAHLTPGVYDLVVLADNREASVQLGLTVSAGVTQRNVTLITATGFISGATVVLDLLNGRQLVPQASIVVRNAAGKVVGVGKSDVRAEFRIAVAAGTDYVLFVQTGGFRPEEVAGIAVAGGTTADLGDIALTPQLVAHVAEPEPPSDDDPPPPGPLDTGDTGSIDDTDPPKQPQQHKEGKKGPKSEGKTVPRPRPPAAPVPEVPPAVVPSNDPNCPEHCQPEIDEVNRLRAALQKEVNRLKNALQDFFGGYGDTAKAAEDFFKNLLDLLGSAPGAKSPSKGLGGDPLKLLGALGALFQGSAKAQDSYDAIGNKAPHGMNFLENVSDFIESSGDFIKDFSKLLSDSAEVAGIEHGSLKLKGLLDDFAKLVDLAKQGADLDEANDRFKQAAADIRQARQKIADLSAQHAAALQKLADCRRAHPDCNQPPPNPLPGKKGGRAGGSGVVSVDPNDIVGPAGFGAAGFLPHGAVLPYTIHFENDPRRATAPALEVTITQTLDADLDLATFELGTIQFGAIVVEVPAGLQSFQTSVAATNLDGTPLRVDVAAALNRQTGVVTWIFRSVDPATGQLPEAVTAGFLPPNDATQRGEGSVNYSVRPKAGLTTGTEIRGVASIVFDTNPPLLTNQPDPSQGSDPNREALVTIDAAPPASSVTPLPPSTGATSVILSWGGIDDSGGSGLASYDVFVSTDSGPFLPLLHETLLTSTVFRGTAGHTYAFYSVAVDNVGQRQDAPALAQATTQMVVANTSTRLAAPVTANVGQAVQVTATVKRLPGAAGKPAGMVTFVEGDTILGTAQLKNVNGAFKAKFTTSTLAVGLRAIEAIFGGNGTLTSSTSAARTVHLLSPTATTLVSSAPTAVKGSNVIFTATMTAAGAAIPLGAVSFFDVFNGVKRFLGTVALDSISGQASLTTSTLKTGTHSISAQYLVATAADFVSSKSPKLRQTIRSAPALLETVSHSEAEPDKTLLDALFVLLGAV